MVEQDAVRGEDAVGLPIIDGDPVGVELGRGIGAAGIERRRLALRRLPDLAEKLAGRCLVEARVVLQPQDTYGLQEAQSPQRVGVGRVLRGLERDLDVALRGEVVDLVGPDLLDDADQVAGIRQVSIMQEKVRVLLVQVLIEPIDTGGVEERAAPLDAMDGVPLPQQERGQIGPVLAGDARDQRCFHLLFLRAVDAANQGFDASFRVKLAQRHTGGAYSAKQREQIEAPRPEQELQGRREHEQLELDLQPQKPRASYVVVEAIEQQMKIVPLGGRHVGDVQTGAAGRVMEKMSS